MSNVFRSDHQQLLPLHRRYDLKGSTLGRTAGPAARASSAPQVSLGTPGTDASTSAGDRASHHSAGASLTAQPWSPESEFDPDVILKDLDLDVAFRCVAGDCTLNEDLVPAFLARGCPYSASKGSPTC